MKEEIEAMNPKSIIFEVFKRLLGESTQGTLALAVKDRGDAIDASLYETNEMIDVLRRVADAGESEALRLAKSAMRGFVRITRPGRTLGDCEGAWVVSKIAGAGYGQVLHSVAAALSPSGLIIADRHVLSPSASGSFRKWSAGKERLHLSPGCITAPRKPGGTLDLSSNPRAGLDTSKNPEHLNYAFRATQHDIDVLYDLTGAHFELQENDVVAQLMDNYGPDFFEDVVFP